MMTKSVTLPAADATVFDNNAVSLEVHGATCEMTVNGVKLYLTPEQAEAILRALDGILAGDSVRVAARALARECLDPRWRVHGHIRNLADRVMACLSTGKLPVKPSKTLRHVTARPRPRKR